MTSTSTSMESKSGQDALLVANSSSDFLQDLLECSVCFEQLDITSKVLPCQHTFCKRCLEGILLTHRELRCPECRILVDVGGSMSGINDLPCNILLIRLLEGIRNNSGGGTSSSSGKLYGVIGQSRSGSTSFGRGSSSRNSFRIAQEIFAQQQQSQSMSPGGHYHNRQQGNQGQHSSPSSSLQGSTSCPSFIGAALSCHEGKAESNELSFLKGDLIILQRRIDANWSYGQLVSSGRTGLFPTSLLQVICHVPSQPSVTATTTTMLPHVRALYDFSMEEKDKEGRDCLSFKKNDIIIFVRRVDENWAMGRIGDNMGIFPLNFVEVTPLVSMLLRQQQQQQNTSSNESTLKVMHNQSISNNVINNNNHADREQQEVQSYPTIPKSSGCNIIYDVVVQSSSPCSSFPTSDSTKPFLLDNNVVSQHQQTSAKEQMTGQVTQIISNIKTPSGINEITENHSTSGEEISSSSLSSEPKEMTVTSVNVPSNINSDADHSSLTTAAMNHKRHSLCAPSSESCYSSPFSSASPSNVVVVHQRSLSHNPEGGSSSARNSLNVESFGREKRKPFPPQAAEQDQVSGYGSVGLLSAKPSVPASALYTAMFDYKPCKPDELQLIRGRLYCVTEKCLDGWYRGSCLRTNATGVFPGNYVEIVKPNPPAPPPQSLMYQSPASREAAFHYQAVYSTQTKIVRSSSPPPLKPKTFGWKSSELLSTTPTSSSCHQQDLPPSSSSSMYARPKPRTLPLNFSRGSGSKSAMESKSKSPPPAVPSTPSPQWQPVQVVATRSFSKTAPFLPISHQTSSSSTSSSSSSPNILDQQQQQQTQEAIQSKEHKSPGNNNTSKKSSSSSSSSSFSNMMRKWTRIGSKSSPANTSSCLSIPASTSSRNANGVNFYCNDNPSFDRSSPTNGLYEDIHPPLTSQSSLHHHHSSSSSHTRSGSCPARTTTSCKGFSPPTNRPLPALPPPPSSSSSRRKERYRAVARYPPNSDFELELEEGDVVIVHKKREDGWIKGTLVKNGKTGLFPKSFVEVIPSE